MTLVVLAGGSSSRRCAPRARCPFPRPASAAFAVMFGGSPDAGARADSPPARKPTPPPLSPFSSPTSAPVSQVRRRKLFHISFRTTSNSHPGADCAKAIVRRPCCLNRSATNESRGGYRECCSVGWLGCLGRSLVAVLRARARATWSEGLRTASRKQLSVHGTGPRRRAWRRRRSAERAAGRRCSTSAATSTSANE
jgi:hypothetical protein